MKNMPNYDNLSDNSDFDIDSDNSTNSTKNKNKQKLTKLVNINKPWIEKYRPSYLNEISSHEQIINTLKNYIENKDLPHLLFYGPSGVGKTSTILSCAKELYGNDADIMVLSINVSEERGIEVVRNRILPFVQSSSLIFSNNPNKLFKLVILDEADSMTSDAQAILRRIIEKYTQGARFCMICNYIKKINIALQSRCTIFRFSAIPNNIIKEKIEKICNLENISISEKVCDSIIEKSNGDLRKVINIIQTSSMISNVLDNNIINEILGYPKSSEIKKIYNSLILENGDTFEMSFKKINKIKNLNGYSLNDIINAIFKKLLNNKNIKNIKNINQIIIKLGTIEYNLINNTNDMIQLAAFVGLFK